jgi:2-polyprenyl-6-methoxyphenol hydroxylase-like FAD-dependent oxidoreductase
VTSTPAGAGPGSQNGARTGDYARPSRAAVVGGGLGGLFTSVVLAHRGWSVTVFEQADELRMFGAGIWLWENGLRSLESIGALEHATRRAQRMSAWEITDPSGRLLRRRETRPWDRLIVPPRADVYDALIRQANLAGVEIVTSARVTAADPQGRVVLGDGTTVTADLVVAADGINSAVRDGLALTRQLRALGNGAIRVLIPRWRDDATDVAWESWNANRGLLYNPCSDEHVYLCLVCPVNDERGRSVPVDRDSWEESFPHLAASIRRIGSDGHWDELKTVTVHAWSKGRVALIGDACHGQPPWLGQAANLTFGNALALAEFVTGMSDLPGALQAWERSCRPVTDHTERWTNAYGRVVGMWPPSYERARSLAVRSFVRTPGVEIALNRAQRHQVPWEWVRSGQRLAPAPKSAVPGGSRSSGTTGQAS